MSPFFVSGLEPLNPGVILELVELQLEASDSPGKNDIGGKELFFLLQSRDRGKNRDLAKNGRKKFLDVRNKVFHHLEKRKPDT